MRFPAYTVHLIGTAMLLSVSYAQAQGLDRIQRRNGTESGKITAVTPLAVTISKGGVASRVPVEEIRSIRFAGEPSEIRSARLAASRGRYQDALDALKKISPQKIDRAEVQQDFDFLLASCTAKLALAKLENLDRATARVSKFLAQHRKSYHLTEAIELLGDLLLAAGDRDGARSQYAKLGKAPAAYFKARSALLLGRLLQDEDQHPEAIAQFEKAVEAAAGNTTAKSLQQEATLLAAISRSATGKAKPSIDTIKEIIAKADDEDTRLLARAYNALGDCYLHSDDKEAARNAYLHVDLLFASVSTEHAKALYELSQLWLALGQQTRAQDAEQRLQDNHPTSPWARR